MENNKMKEIKIKGLKELESKMRRLEPIGLKKLNKLLNKI